MPSVRKSEKEKQREELAALLGEPVFLRDEAAPKIGKTPAAMDVEPHKRPPFYQKRTAGTVLYPQSWLDEFRRTGQVISPDTGKVMSGRRPWPPAPPTPAPSVPAPPKKRITKKKREAANIVLDLIRETDPERRRKFIEGEPE
jgi:hypothetical protein